MEKKKNESRIYQKARGVIQSKVMKKLWQNGIYDGEEYRKKISDGVKKVWEDPDSIFNSLKWREELSKRTRELFKDPIFLKKYQDGNKSKPNNCEKSILNLLKELDLDEYIFVGDHSLWIGGKNPDFINENENKIIEFFGDYWHSEEVTGVSHAVEEERRIKHFEEYGYQVLVIWEYELKNKELLRKKRLEDLSMSERWDRYYYGLCKEVAKNSQCLSRKIGAILVKDKSIVSTGYNGPPRGVRTCDERWLNDKKLREAGGFETPDTNVDKDEFQAIYNARLEGICPRYIAEMGFKSGEGLEWCVAGHAERNALINAARAGIATKGLKIYMDCGVPCTPCLVEIINAGIEEIIVTKMTFYDQSSEYLLKESGIAIRVYDHLKEV